VWLNVECCVRGTFMIFAPRLAVTLINPLTPNDLQRRRTVSPLKMKSKTPIKNMRGTHHVTRHNTPIHNILSTVPQLSISQKALRMLPEDGNVMSKHVGTTIHN
jgi:hypothetical protein